MGSTGFCFLAPHCCIQDKHSVVLPVNLFTPSSTSRIPVDPHSRLFLTLSFNCLQILPSVNVYTASSHSTLPGETIKAPSWSLYSRLILPLPVHPEHVQFKSHLNSLWRGFTCSLLLFSYKDPSEISLVLSHSCTGMTLMMYSEKRHQNLNAI